jgi:hypothetical protein
MLRLRIARCNGRGIACQVYKPNSLNLTWQIVQPKLVKTRRTVKADLQDIRRVFYQRVLAGVTASSKDGMRSTLIVLLGQEAREMRTMMQDITVASREPWTNQRCLSHVISCKSDPSD